MHPNLQRNLYFVREHVGMFKAANNYDILDPSTGAELMHCREPNLGIVTKLMRFTDYKRMTPFDLHVTTPEGQPLLRVHRGITFFLSKVKVSNEEEQLVGMFKQKLFSIGGAFTVLDDAGQPLCKLKGKWTSWDFQFLSPDDKELAHVTKKWGGLGKELFTTADNYILQISDTVAKDSPLRLLIIAAVMCIDMVLKE